ncbi:MAG TPA: C25 family cysteine peptidase [Patescibacteria group bacterium]|nr:C25 family cysteine peptidase [Patescibacteria group bacterium]
MTTRIATFFFALLLIAVNVRAASITRSFRFAEPEIIRNGDGVVITMSGCRTIGRTGEPALPVFAASFLLPPGERVTDIRFQLSESVVLPGPFEFAPTPPQVPLGERAVPHQRNEAVYGSPLPYPDEPVVLVTEQVCAGMRIAFINLFPCSIVPSTGVVHFSPSITVTVETAPGRAYILPAPPLARARALGTVERFVVNGEDGRAYDYPERAMVRSGDDPAYIPFVIITSQALASPFQALADLRNSLCLRTAIVDLDSIYAGFSGDDAQEQIRNFITYAYTTWQTEYVLLGGDDEIIPHRGFYVMAGSEIETDIPSDLYYAALDGDWNTDGDAYFGEPGEEDLLPEVCIGRAPVDSESEVESFVAKIVHYTLTPPPSQCTEALMTGELLWSIDGVDTWGGDYKDEIRYGSSNHGFTTEGLPGFFGIGTLYDRDLGYSWTTGQVVSYLNAGVSLVNHLGHANLHSVMRVAVDDVPLLTNSGTDAINYVCYSQGCYVASFDNRDDVGTVHLQDAIGEEFVTGPTGAVALIGNSRLGWNAPGSTCGVSQFFDRQFFDALFGEYISSIGEALDDSRIDNIPYLSYPVVRYVMYGMTLLGDPAMHVWTDEPRTLTVLADSVLDTDQEIYTVEVHDNAGAVEDARVSLSGEQAGQYFTGFTDDRGIVYLQTGTVTSGTLTLAVFAPNHFPYNRTVQAEDVSSAHPKIVYLCAENAYFRSGDGGGTIGSNGWFNLDIILENIGSRTAEETAITLTRTIPSISILDSICYVGDLPARTSIIKDNAFTISLDSEIPQGQTIELEFEITALDGRWSTQHALLVKGAAVALESWSITDTLHGNGNGCIESWEFQDLHCTWRNIGSVDLDLVMISLTFPAESWARVTDGMTIIQSLPAGGVVNIENELVFFIGEQAPPFSDITMFLSLAAPGFAAHRETLTVQTCGYEYDSSVQPLNLWDHHAITGVDGWHLSGERYYSSPESWKCGNTAPGAYANMMEAVLVSPPLCLYENSRLTFYHWIDAEASTYYPYWAEDAGVVEISTDGGDTWSILAPAGNYPARASATNTIFLNPYQRCYSSQFGWEFEDFDLSAYHGPVRLRFHFASNEQYGFEGWYIDDIMISTELVTEVDDEIPAAVHMNALLPAHPNPFNPVTVIPFEIERGGHVELTVHDVAGRRIRTLVSRPCEAGRHETVWDGTNERGTRVASGVYFCMLKTGVYRATQRLVLVR